MGPTSSAPAGGPGHPLPGPAGPPPGYGPPRPAEATLTKAQRSRVVTTFVVLVLVGAGLGLLVATLLPKEYAAQSSIRYTIGRGSDDADRVLATQTVLITGREVLQGAADAAGVPVEYLTDHSTAAVVPNSEIIHIQVRHPSRPTGVQLADAVARRYLEVAGANSPRAAVQKQLADLQQQLTSGVVPAAQLPELRLRIAAVQGQLDDLATTENLPSLAAPAYSLPDQVFPNTPATVGGGALVGLIVAGLVSSALVRRTRE